MRRLPMQLALLDVEQRGIDALLDQRMGEHIVSSLRAAPDRRRPARRSDSRSRQSMRATASSENRLPMTEAACSACFVEQRPADPCAPGPGSECWPAGSPLRSPRHCAGAARETADCPRRARCIRVPADWCLHQARSEQLGFLRPQRTQIHCHQRTAVCRGAPGLVERIALEARSHDQHQTSVGCRAREQRQIAHEIRRRPVNILDRSAGAGAASAQRCRMPAIISPMRCVRVAWSIASNAARNFGRLRQLEQIVDQHLLIGCDEAARQRALHRRRATRHRRPACRPRAHP